MDEENRNSTRPTISLANENSSAGPSVLQQMKIDSTSTKSTKKIRTFWIWSILNLIFVPFGFFCCYFSYQVGKFRRQQRYERAKLWSKRTFVLNIFTTLLMFGLIVTIVMLRYDYHQRYDSNPINQTRTTGPYIPWQPGR